jgi:hypothetical protein
MRASAPCRTTGPAMSDVTRNLKSDRDADAQKDVVRGSRENAHSGLVLSGDFVSPEHLLAADHLSDAEKRSVLDQWLKDIDAGAPAFTGHDPDALRDLRRSIEDARERIA